MPEANSLESENVEPTTSWRRADLVLALLVGLAVRTAAVLASGVLDAGDSPNYLKAVAQWSGSHFVPSWLFSGYQGRQPIYIAFLAIVSRLGPPGSIMPVVVQAVMSAGVPLVLYAGVRLGGGSKRAAWATWALALASYELSRWNAYILADALFIDLSAAALVALVLSLRSGSPTWSWLTGVAIVLALFVRGTGVALVAAALLASVFWRPFARARVIAVLSALLAYVAYFALSPVPLEARGTPLDGVCTYLVSGRVLWGMDEYRMTPIPNDTERTDRQCIYQAVTRFPGHTAAVAFRKAAIYWMPFYGHYSPRHRLANTVLIGGPFILAVLALLVRPWQIGSDPLRLVPLLWMASFTALHAVTWVEGDHRFLAPVLPAVYVLAGTAVVQLLDLFHGTSLPRPYERSKLP
jgi:hypothetical protein